MRTMLWALLACGVVALPAAGQSIFDDWPGTAPRKVAATRPAVTAPPAATQPAVTTAPAPTPVPAPATARAPVALTPTTAPAPGATQPATPEPVVKAPDKPVGPTKLAEPSAVAQKETEKQIREVFVAEYAKVAPADKQALARKLIKHGTETTDSPAAKYVLFREARDLATQAGDPHTATDAIEAMDEAFAIDAREMKFAALLLLPRAVRGAEGAKALAEETMALVEEYLRADLYERAQRLALVAEPAARNSGDSGLAAHVTARCKEIVALQREDLAVKNHRKTLLTKPDDPEANFAVGRFLFVIKKDEKGLAMLAQGSDETLKQLAQKELAGPTDAAGQCALGDAWWDYAQADRTQWKAQYQARAVQWYGKALPGLTGLNKAKVEKRLEDLEKDTGVLDLIALVDATRDAVRGTWRFEGRTLASPLVGATAVSAATVATPTGRLRYVASSYPLLALPYVPPDEYDLEVVAERTRGLDELAIGLAGGGKQFTAVLCGDRGTTNGLGMINGIYPYLSLGRPYYPTDPTSGNPTVLRYYGLKPGQTQTILISVRKASVVIKIDGLTLVDWKADYSRVSLETQWATPNPNQLSIGVGRASSFNIHRMTLKPVSGRGKKLR
jgi:hypothetical protein